MGRTTSHIATFLGLPGKLTGPILDKELRVSSRRRRNYLLRFGYLAAMMLFIGLMWLTISPALSRGNSPAYRIAQMPMIGKQVILCIVWFQFLAAQLLAVVMLSTSISDEISHRTLGVLMTTPISSLQIVVGKLLSKLLQLLILLGISLPLLAVVRVFGGVPWDFIISSLCLTLCAILFAASVSLYFSIRNRQAYVVILRTLVAGAVVYALLPWLAYELNRHVLQPESGLANRDMQTILLNSNPFAMLSALTREMLYPWGAMPLYWPVTCLISLGASLAVLLVSTLVVRRVALRQATGEAGLFSRRKSRKLATAGAAAGGSPAGTVQAAMDAAGNEEPIRRVRGSPIVWKELKTPLFRGRVRRILMPAATLGLLLLTYGACAAARCLNDRDVMAAYGAILLLLAMTNTAIFSATTITTEKENRSWPILLGTTLSDWEILLGKAIGIVRRCLPVWLLLIGHVAFFVILGFLRAAALLHTLMIAAWVTAFFVGTGLFFSARFNRTTTAVILNLALAFVIWAAVPFASIMIEEGVYSTDTFSAGLVSGNPVVQIIVATLGAGNDPYRNGYRAYAVGVYDWPDRGAKAFNATTVRILGWSLLYLLIAAAGAAMAKATLRRRSD